MFLGKTGLYKALQACDSSCRQGMSERYPRITCPCARPLAGSNLKEAGESNHYSITIPNCARCSQACDKQSWVVWHQWPCMESTRSRCGITARYIPWQCMMPVGEALHQLVQWLDTDSRPTRGNRQTDHVHGCAILMLKGGLMPIWTREFEIKENELNQNNPKYYFLADKGQMSQGNSQNI